MSFSSFAQQLKEFSKDPAQFPLQIASLFKNIQNSKERDKTLNTLDTFNGVWNSGMMKAGEQLGVIKIANQLLEHRVQNLPWFRQYLQIIVELKVHDKPEALGYWLKSLEDLMVEGSTRQIQNYLDMFNEILTTNTLFKSATFEWKVKESGFLFRYDTIPRFSYRKTDLICTSQKDTSIIYNTSGTFFPTEMKWTGEGGTMNWKRLGFNSDSVSATLRNYKIDLRYSKFTADSVTFYNRKFFHEPLFGALEDRVLSSPPNANSEYPQFVSYLKNYEIPGLFKDVDYLGGFSMKGAKLIGSGEVDENAQITIKRKDKPLIILKSTAFIIDGDKISANPASVVILTGADSIFHPGLQMKYSDISRKLELIRPNQGLARSPFFNTYHNVDMDCGGMTWRLGADTINFESIHGINPVSVADFTSIGYYSEYDFDRLQGIDERNPLYVIKKFASLYNTREISPGMLSEYMQITEEQVKSMLLKLSIMGFLYYDQVNDKAYIQNRLFNYLDAKAGTRDYDVINIHSEIKDKSNAALNLNNFDLLIRGVREVFLSNLQNVYIYPKGDEITLKKDRDFMFSGTVKAGLFDYYARECSFEYDSFRLNLPTIDSLGIKVKSFTENAMGKKLLRKVGNMIEDLSGRILIDDPGNKSGRKNFPQYPVFISEQESYVYYDQDSIYNKDKFKYIVKPFRIDSLDNFSTDNLHFDGYLISAGIFPEIKKPISVQPDYSLGFITKTPKEGLPVYGGLATFSNKIDLSNKGLLAEGSLKFLTSTSVSSSFKFYPDSLITSNLKTFRVQARAAGVKYPSVAIDSARMIWHPYQDTMLVNSYVKPFKMFDGKTDLSGQLLYSSTGLSGKGLFRFENSKMKSDEFKFSNQTVDADTVDFYMMEKETNEIAVSSMAYKAHVDFRARRVTFNSNLKGSVVEFPYSKFSCSMEKIDWFIDKDELIMSNDQARIESGIDSLSKEELMDIDLSRYGFTSTNPEQDSLNFFSVTARYDLNKYIIYAEGVRLMKVADAAIFPDGGNVMILKGGKIDTLKNAEIITNISSKYHHIKGAEVDIFSRKNYNAKGIYPYIDMNKTEQDIYLGNISVDSLGRTVGEGSILEKDNFWLSPYFPFMGKVSMLSVQPYLTFDGGFHLAEDCLEDNYKNWVTFKEMINPENVHIPIGNPSTDLNGTPLETGVFISDYQDGIYPVLFDRRKILNDTAIVNASGYISYDTTISSYLIYNGQKFDPNSPSGYFLLNTKSCSIQSYGDLNLGFNMGYVKLQSFGKLDYMIVPDSAQLQLSFTLDFMFDNSMLRMLSDSLTHNNLTGLDVNKPLYKLTLIKLLGTSKAAEVYDDISSYGTLRKLPDELAHTFIFMDVNMYWNSETSSYISRGPIGILSIDKDPVNRYVNGYIELNRRRSGDAVTFYLELNKNQWYFFDYHSGFMQTLSSDLEYNKIIEELKQQKRSMSLPDEAVPYEFTIATRRKLIDFLRRMDALVD